MLFLGLTVKISDLSDQLTSDISTLLHSSGYALVRVKKMGGDKYPLLQIMIERDDDASITVSDCEIVTKLLDPLFSVHDPLPDAYQLEVSSPGLDRPLLTINDFHRFCGNTIKMRFSPPINGRRKAEGVLQPISLENPEAIIVITSDQQIIAVNYKDIQDARIVITDAMIAAELKKRETAE
jgi:ribosome maturation factor RimP